MKIEILLLKLELNKTLTSSDASKVRGFLGSLYRQHIEVHHHQPDGTLLYRYPVVQYKIIQDNCVIIGFGAGIEIVKKIFDELKVIIIDGNWQDILAKSLYNYTDEFGTAADFIAYTFLTPWLALNEENYETYQKYGNWQKRRELLTKILIGNILSIAKGINYTVTEPISVKFDHLRETRTTLKGTPMLGFLGNFQVNFAIPDYWGIGKSVARGFGTIGRCSW